MRFWIVIVALLSTPALAGGRPIFTGPQLNFHLGNRRVIVPPEQPFVPNGAFIPRSPYPIWYYTQPEPPPPAPAPQIVYIEREPAPAPPAPQVIIIQPPPPPEPPQVVVAPPPPPPAPVVAAPVRPWTPGPDVYNWIDDDGVVHYSTNVPASMRARAKKLGGK